jgi:hypothetical protein
MKLKLKNIKKANRDLRCCFKDLLYLQQNTLKGIIGEVIVDLMAHNYPLMTRLLFYLKASGWFPFLNPQSCHFGCRIDDFGMKNII